jgi:hypothetical protein
MKIIERIRRALAARPERRAADIDYLLTHPFGGQMQAPDMTVALMDASRITAERIGWPTVQIPAHALEAAYAADQQ